ncbi:MAG: hypothetical protein IT423_12940 [Pirellulaceae bacterium]|nr:hypothetical protein [Pirellulaceae bacterium]
MSSQGSGDRSDGSDAGYVLRSWMESALAEPKTGLTDREWQELAGVVKGSGQDPAALAECVTSLVSAFIRLRFPKITDDGLRSRMSSKIAHTLCSDPTARGRLVELQSLLQRSAP